MIPDAHRSPFTTHHSPFTAHESREPPMPLLRIRLLGDPILRRKCRAVARVAAEDRRLIDDMLETMEDANGAGLAAPQVGVDRRIVIVRLGETRKHAGEVVPLINPIIIRRSKELEVDVEGCLSLPTVQGEVERHVEIVVRALNPKGRKVELTERGFGARVIQHELDHLDGMLFIDRILPDTLDFVRTKVNDEGEEELVLVPTTLEQVTEYFRTRSRRVHRLPTNAVVA